MTVVRVLGTALTGPMHIQILIGMQRAVSYLEYMCKPDRLPYARAIAGA